MDLNFDALLYYFFFNFYCRPQLSEARRIQYIQRLRDTYSRLWRYVWERQRRERERCIKRALTLKCYQHTIVSFLLVIYTVSFSIYCHQSSCLHGQAHKLWILSPMLWPAITMDISHHVYSVGIAVNRREREREILYVCIPVCRCVWMVTMYPIETHFMWSHFEVLLLDTITTSWQGFLFCWSDPITPSGP